MIESAVVTFVATNVDVFVALSVLFATIDGARRTRAALACASAGFFVLLLISAGGAAGLATIPRHATAWLGLAPVAVGAWRGCAWLRAPRHALAVAGEGASALSGTFVLVLATGGDNLAAYIPFFAQIGVVATLVVAAAYMLAFVALCVLAMSVSAGSALHRRLKRIAQPLSAGLFIVVGCSVIVRGLR